MNLPSLPPAATNQAGLLNWLRAVVSGIAAGWGVEHKANGTHKFTWTTHPFAAGDYIGTGNMTWAVGQNNRITYRYRVVGHTLQIRFAVIGANVGGTASSQSLGLRIPPGYTISDTPYQDGVISYIDAGGARAMGLCTRLNNYILCQKADGSAWTLTAANDTSVVGSIELELS